MASNAPVTVNDGTDDIILSPRSLVASVAAYHDLAEPFMAGRKTLLVTPKELKTLREIRVVYKDPDISLLDPATPVVTDWGTVTQTFLIPARWSPVRTEMLIEAAQSLLSAAMIRALVAQDERVW